MTPDRYLLTTALAGALATTVALAGPDATVRVGDYNPRSVNGMVRTQSRAYFYSPRQMDQHDYWSLLGRSGGRSRYGWKELGACGHSRLLAGALPPELLSAGEPARQMPPVSASPSRMKDPIPRPLARRSTGSNAAWCSTLRSRTGASHAPPRTSASSASSRSRSMNSGTPSVSRMSRTVPTLRANVLNAPKARMAT